MYKIFRYEIEKGTVLFYIMYTRFDMRNALDYIDPSNNFAFYKNFVAQTHPKAKLRLDDSEETILRLKK